MESSTVAESLQLQERTGRLETSVTNLHSELSDVKVTLRLQGEAQAAGFRELENLLRVRAQTNWPVIFGIITLVGALYAAAIQPIKQDLERIQHSSERLAAEVIIKDGKIIANTAEIGRMTLRMEGHEFDLKQIYNQGSPITDKRLSLIEYRLGLITPPR